MTVAGRVARNVGFRAAAELIGKFSTLALMALLARSVGPTGLGVFVLALAWTEVGATAINMGLDLLLLKTVARDRDRIADSLFNVLLLKLFRAIPVVATSWFLVAVLDYSPTTQHAIYLLTGAFLFESVRETLFAVFNGLERADLVGTVLVSQRLLVAALGLIAIGLGYGVVAVAGAFLIGAMVAAVLGCALLSRAVGMPPLAVPSEPRRELRRASRSLSAQDIVSAGIARLDTILLSFFATPSVVGLYGAAYRLLEATIFVSSALVGAFAAMYAYLDERSSPTIGAVYARSIKLSFVLLLPLAMPLAILPGPLLELIYGDGFGPASGALRLLAPTLVILGTVILSGSIVVARLDARLLVRSFVVALVVNLIANVTLIPTLGATGAALAMLITELVLLMLLVRMVAAGVGFPPVLKTFGSGAAAGAAFGLVLWVLGGVLLPVALVAGAATYVGIFVLVERRVAPEDLRTITATLRSRGSGGAADSAGA